MALRALLLSALLAILAGRTFSSSAFPCHMNRTLMGVNVTCTGVALPPGLCSKCPLRPTNANGTFVSCWNIFDTSAPGCLRALAEYANANPCDAVRVNAVRTLQSDPTHGDALATIDYFLYSLCEQCCDCIPMGAQASLYSQYLAAHTAASPTLYDPTRGNCPAHAYYDICKVLPHVTHFTRLGDPPTANFSSLPPACSQLTAWFNSSASASWQTNPKTTIVPTLRAFFLNMLSALGCSQSAVWSRCYTLESAQDHLDLPSAAPESGALPTPEVVIPAPPLRGTGADNTAPTPGARSAAAPGSAARGIVAGAAPSNSSRTARACFPAGATVELRGGRSVRMDALRIGDWVRVADARFSPVYLFSHRDARVRATHLRVLLASGVALELSPGHLLPVNGALAPADAIRPGDSLEGVRAREVVRGVAVVRRRGLYNPHTAAGTIVVDGVVCSTYTTAVRTPAAHALLAPLRALFRAGAVTEASAGGVLRRGVESLPILVGSS